MDLIRAITDSIRCAPKIVNITIFVFLTFALFFLTRKEAQFQWRASVKLTHDGTSKPCALFYQWALSAKQVASQADYFTVGYHRQKKKSDWYWSYRWCRMTSWSEEPAARRWSADFVCGRGEWAAVDIIWSTEGSINAFHVKFNVKKTNCETFRNIIHYCVSPRRCCFLFPS
jgi:hypothetical protein